MKRPLLFLLLFVPNAAFAAVPRGPRLAVLIVVDQMRADFPDRFHKKGPLARRLARATVFTDVLHDHVPTTTSPGHAAIATGRSPAVNGIPENDIFDRATRKTFPATSDPKQGVGPFRLKAKTVADAVKAANPAARVISVSLKDRAAVLLGGQHPDAAVWYDPVRQRFVTSAWYGALPAWAEAENADLPDLAKSVTLPFSESDFSASPAADRAVVALSTRAIAAESLGADDVCDLLLVSLSATDLIGHRWGPGSRQMEQQLEALQTNLETLLEAAEKASGGRLAVVITADHGSLDLPESAEGRRVGARRVMITDFVPALESALQAAFPAKGKKWLQGVRPPDIFLNRDLAKTLKIPTARWLRESAEALRQVPDVAAVYVPGEPSDDPFAAIYRRSWLDGVSGDLQIRTAPGVLLSRWPTGTSHGTPYPYDAVVPAFFLGTGGAAGRVTREVSVESLAPTLAAALGVTFPAGDAPPLPEALPLRGR